jgi:hypothetical protein
MNPPFVAYHDMDDAQRETVQAVLGGVAHNRPDVAMAFLWKAVNSLRPQGVTASVLPAPLLETASGRSWREALCDIADLQLLGRLGGYSFFRGSLVEPAFVLIQKGSDRRVPSGHLKVVVAEPGAEDEAIRALRLCDASKCLPVETGYEVFSVNRQTLTAASWSPKPRRLQRIVENLETLGHPRVAGVFDVHESAKTGCNRAFMLKDSDYSCLPTEERRYFRPVAGTRTIGDGRVRKEMYVFFPYKKDGPRISTEEDLKAKMTEYYAKWLEPNKGTLQRRPGVSAGAWWLLDRARTWQYERIPKLVTKAWGLSGGFAFDQKGEFVVVGGHAWLPRGGMVESGRAGFEATPLPWAYLAVLNSILFEHLLAWSCPRVQGGQYDLSPQFVKNVFLPQLSETGFPCRVLAELEGLGRRIHSGDMPAPAELDAATAKAYPSQVEKWLQETQSANRSI